MPASRLQIIAAQINDYTLIKCFDSVVDSNQLDTKKIAYFVKNDLLMRKGCSNIETEGDWINVYQIVIPSAYRQHVLCLAHDHVMSGHLGTTQTYNRILKHSFGIV